MTDFDKFTLKFIEVLDKLNIKYVLISGYISLLFGRSRMTEDINLFVEKISFNKFSELWNEVIKKFDCINAETAKETYYGLLTNSLSVNFSIKGKFLPMMEVKLPKTDIDWWTLKNKKKVILNGKILFISPLELQIPFKIKLGSKKDFEDARFLYKLFKKNLNKELFNSWIRNFKIEGEVKYLYETP